MRRHGRTERRLKKLLWHIRVPKWVDNCGVRLPTDHPLITPGIRRQIFFGEYEAKEAEIVSRRLADDDVVMEVGAGIGYLSALCARRLGNGRVFAYEANPALLEIIAATHRENGVAPSVRNALLAEGAGKRTLFIEPEFWASSALAGSGAAQPIVVEQADLNAELAAVCPTFLIVDIEGGEIEFFALARLDGVRKICVETHPGMASDASLSKLFSRLFAQGFALDFSLIRKNVFYFYRP
ncbi:MAG: FkbM family methyltransferase [Betaproteobacteria bacterium]|nr:FkbM family methyltransferase [Betaproteobacteria bacterium]